MTDAQSTKQPTETLPTQDHPEQRPGEVFLTNVYGNEPDAFEEIAY